jgi:predicted DNA-binding protein YlxM (UPF0122 family)
MDYEQQCKDMYAFFTEENWVLSDIAEEFEVSTNKAVEMILEGEKLSKN